MISTPSRHAKAFIALAALALIWGYSWIAVKQILQLAGPFTVSAYRSIGGTLSLLVLIIVLKRPLRVQRWPTTAVIGLLQSAVFVLLSTWALVTNGPGKTSLLIFTMPIWLLLMGHFTLEEPLNRRQWMMAGTACAGLMLTIAPGWGDGRVTGQFLGVLAGVAWAAATIVQRRAFVSLSGSQTEDPLSLTMWQMAIGSIPLVVVAAGVHEPRGDASLQFLGLLAFVTVVSTAVGWLVWAYVVDILPGWQASTGILGVPLVTNVSSSLWHGESLSHMEFIGATLLFVALGGISVQGSRGTTASGKTSGL